MHFMKEEPFVRQALHVHPTVKTASVDLFKPLRCRDSRLFYILDGKGSIQIEGRVYPLQPNSVFLFKAGTTYEWRLEWADYYVLNFDYNQDFADIEQTFHPLYSNQFEKERCFDCGVIQDVAALEDTVHLTDAITLKHAVQNIVAEYHLSGEWRKPLLSVLLKHVIIEILRINNNKCGSVRQHTVVKRIVAYIQDHYNESINNQTIAEHFGYNPNYLGRIFKQYTGSSISDFISDLRISVAVDALRNSSLSVGEVGELVGMPDIYHFSKFFKNKTKLTPTQYKKQFLSDAK